ncbi:MAG: HEPN domain-containing protein [Parcubacteria group bacterium]|nr:HEPN domain-containing protein [Parcubacteria group bacterium]
MDNINKQINYWKISAENNWKTALDLFKTKHYDACLFFCHLTLEKLLKGLAVKEMKESAPRGHDLPELANLAKLTLNQEQMKNLKIITTFNIAARYDTHKYNFYKMCTKEYASHYLEISKNLSLWLKEQYL